MPRPLKRGILGASTIILSKDIDNYAYKCRSNFYRSDVMTVIIDHGLRTPNEGINQTYLKKWADVADKICCRHT